MYEREKIKSSPAWPVQVDFSTIVFSRAPIPKHPHDFIVHTFSMQGRQQPSQHKKYFLLDAVSKKAEK